jgi:hypothetical protein
VNSPPDGADAFTSGPPKMRALLRWIGHEPDWQIYAHGYRRAIEVLVDAVKKNSAYRGTLIFPIGALCRHAIELSLKRLLVLLHEELAKTPTLQHTHDIVGLWGVAQEPLARLSIDELGTEDTIGLRIRTFAHLDRSGEAFRYPTSKNGEILLPMDALNVAGLHGATLGLLTDLDALAHVLLDIAQDRRDDAMHDAAEAWWWSLDEDVRADYEAQHEALNEAYLRGYLDMGDER